MSASWYTCMHGSGRSLWWTLKDNNTTGYFNKGQRTAQGNASNPDAKPDHWMPHLGRNLGHVIHLEVSNWIFNFYSERGFTKNAPHPFCRCLIFQVPDVRGARSGQRDTFTRDALQCKTGIAPRPFISHLNLHYSQHGCFLSPLSEFLPVIECQYFKALRVALE